MQKHRTIIEPLLPGSHKSKDSKKKKAIAVLSVIIAIVAITTVYLWLNFSNSSAKYIQSDKYQAIFMTNNQVYFGKLSKLGDGSYRVTDVFYVKDTTSNTGASTSQSTPNTATDQTQKPQLVKLGNELHGPTDEVMIPPQNLLFWENLKPDGTVSKSIAEYKKTNK